MPRGAFRYSTLISVTAHAQRDTGARGASLHAVTSSCSAVRSPGNAPSGNAIIVSRDWFVVER